MTENWIKSSRCGESTHCYGVEEVGGRIHITGERYGLLGVADDTAEAWRKFRDDIKAGVWDHIGESGEVSR